MKRLYSISVFLIIFIALLLVPAANAVVTCSPDFFVISSGDASLNLAVTFKDQTPCGDIYKWYWFFGDGTPITEISAPPGPPGDTTHTYSSAGGYDVNLTVYWSGEPLRWKVRQVHIPLPVHNLNLDRNYNTISAALSDGDIDEGHTILVDSGTYNENIDISMPIILRGNDTGTGYPVIDAMKYSNSPISLFADQITLEMFNVTNSSGSYPGISIGSSDNIITNIIATGNDGPGIRIATEGVLENNTIRNVHTTGNGQCGLYLVDANNNTLTNITSDNNGSNGITIEYGDSNQITNSTITGNSEFGIDLERATNTLIRGNTIEENSVKGIYLTFSTDNTISNNTMEGNGEYGLYLDTNSYSNTIYNNKFNNDVNAVFELSEGTNTWDIAEADCSTPPNIIGGRCLGGNYWAQPDGLGFSQLYADITGDGIADTIYTDSDGITDSLPLTLNSLPELVSTEAPSAPGWKFRGDLQNTGVYDDGGIRPNGNERWNFSSGCSRISSSPAIADGIVYIQDDCGDSLYALNADNGTELWNISQITGQSSPAVANGVLYIGDNYGYVYAIDTGTHVIRWRYNTGSSVASSPTIANGLVYILDTYVFMPETLLALDASSGGFEWSYSISGTSSPALSNGMMYVGSYDNKVYALNAATGAEIWNFTTGDDVTSSPAVSNGVVYVGSDDYNIYALCANTGQKHWNFTTGGYVSSSPAVANGVVYAGSNDNKVYALNADTGAEIWNFTTGDYVTSSPAVANGVVYIVDENSGCSHCRTLYAIDAETGNELWYIDGIYGQSSPAVSNGVVYVGSDDGKLYAIGTTPPLANFTATPTSGTASLAVQFNDTSTGYPASWSWDFGDGTPALAQRNPVHTYTSAGTYSVTLTVTNRYGANSTTKSGYIIVSSPTSPPSYAPGGGGGGGGGAFMPQEPQQPEPGQPLEPPAPLTPEEQPVEGLAGLTFTQSYPVGFEGLSFNADGQNSLSLDLSAAEQAGATVTTFFDRVEVYQHGSPGVRITFFFDTFNQTAKFITGTAKGAEFETDPLTLNVSSGKVAGSVRAVLTSISQPVKVENSITGNISAGNLERFRTVMAQNNLDVAGIAYLMDFQRGKLTSTGAANVTLTVPASWVDQHGGKDAVRITRISDTTGITELINTVYTGADSGGNMIFRGESPHGTSIFGLLTAKATTAKQMEEPNVTIQPLQKPALITEIGMFAWLLGMLKDNPVVIVVIIAVIGVVLYVTWKRRQV